MKPHTFINAAITALIVVTLVFCAAGLAATTVLLNGQPAIVEVDDIKHLSKFDLLSEPDYLRILSRHSEALLWPYAGGLIRMERLPDGGERYMFNFKLLNGCEACPHVGTLTVGYDFDAAGRFTGVKLIKLVTAD